jgi:O-antigen ligase
MAFPSEPIVNNPLSDDQHRSIADVIGQLDVSRIARCMTFIAGILVVWISLRPFPDLGNPSVNDLNDGKLASTYVTLAIFAAVALALGAPKNVTALRFLLTPAFVMLCCWMCINTVFSQNVEISLQRLVLTGCVVTLAACLLLLPDSQAELDRWLAASIVILLAVCYLGVLLAPSLSIHLSTDLGEPQLAGDWRGAFGHKNVAAPVMAMIVFMGFYLTSRGAHIVGPLIAILAAVFLIFTGGKSATGLCIATFALSIPVYWIGNSWVRATLCYLPMVVLNLFSVGSVFSENVAAIAKLLPLDTTFNGRIDIWEFAIEALHMRPLFGYGFAAFWGSSSIENLVTNDQIEWAASASHSHNGYLDSALTMGYPGLALVMIVFVFAPLRNFSVAVRSGNDGPLTMLFLRIWLFGICLSSMESFLLDRADPIWFTFLIAIFGLHYISRFRMMPETAASI